MSGWSRQVQYWTNRNSGKAAEANESLAYHSCRYFAPGCALAPPAWPFKCSHNTVLNHKNRATEVKSGDRVSSFNKAQRWRHRFLTSTTCCSLCLSLELTQLRVSTVGLICTMPSCMWQQRRTDSRYYCCDRTGINSTRNSTTRNSPSE